MGRKSLGAQGRRERHQVWEANQRSAAADQIADLTLTEWRETLTYFEYRCAWCGYQPDGSRGGRRDVLSLDYIVKHGGTTQRNCVPACTHCHGFLTEELPPGVRAFLLTVGGPVTTRGPVTHFAPDGHPLCASDRDGDNYSGTARTVTCTACLWLKENR